MNRQKHIRHGRRFLFASAVGIAAGAGPAAAQTSHICSTENVDRSIEIIQPAYGSAVCKVLYRKPDEGASDQVFWRSNQSMASCEKKAQKLIASLTSDGFDCIAGNLYAQSPAAQPAAVLASVDESDIDTTANVGNPQAGVSATSLTEAAPPPSGGRPYQRLFGGTDTKWHIAGYADATFEAVSNDGDTTTSFGAARFNPAFHFQYKDLVLLEAEAEISVDDDGETEFELEYAQADLLIHDNVTLVLGQFLSPVGQFQERLHPTWINRLANPPAGFGHDGVQPASEVGVMARGGVSIGSALVTYAIAVGNGPTVSHEGGVMFEASGADDNSNKAVSGRLGFLPVPYLEVGGSFLVGDVSGSEMADEEDPMDGGMSSLSPTDGKVTLWGADAAYTRGAWDARVEYLNVTRDPFATAFEGSLGVEMLPELKLEAWYAQIAYSLSGLTDHPVLQKFEPAVRYGKYKVSGLDELAEEAAERRVDVGLNYWLAPSLVARGVVEWRDFTARPEEEPSSQTRYILQFAYGF